MTNIQLRRMAFVTAAIAGATIISLGLSTTLAAAQATHDAPGTLVELKAAANTDITARITQLDVLIGRINVATPDCGANDTIVTKLTVAKTGLTSLNGQIQALTKVVEGRGLFGSIYKDYRVYALQTPIANIAVACSTLLKVDTSLKQASTRLQTLSNGLIAAGKDLSVAQTQLDAANKKIDIAHDAIISTISAAELTPDAGDNASLVANNAALKAAHQTLKVGAQSYRAARTGLQQTIDTLKLAVA